MGPRSIDRGKWAAQYDGNGFLETASMGPRSIDRGKVAGNIKGSFGQNMLQWGHDQLIVESSVQTHPRIQPRAGFNGATIN